jgi:hydrogenase maturation protease
VSGTLVGGIGNIFLGDDAFGVEVVRLLATRPSRPDVHVVDFGIRALDLAFALRDYDAVILIDAMQRGGPPGTLYVLDPLPGDATTPADGLTTHGITPADVLRLATLFGAERSGRRLRIVGCEPASVPADGDVHVGLSAPVAQALAPAVELVEQLLNSAAGIAHA